MKLAFTLPLAASVGLLVASTASATPLPTSPTTSVAPSTVLSFAGTEVGTPFTFDFSNSKETGSVVEDVFDNNGSLDFYYQVTDDAGSIDGLSRLTAGDFTGYATDVAYIPDSGSSGGSTTDVAPGTADRHSADTVGFNFYVAPGQTSDWLEIATNATTQAAGSLSVIDGQSSSTDQAVGPESTPEPSTWALLLASAAGGLINLVRRRL